MADIKYALEKVLKDEGGYVLHNVSGDKGGMTYAGISRNNWPNWEGWQWIDQNNETVAKALVGGFYRDNFWSKMLGDQIISDKAAYVLFDFYINAGGYAIKCAQRALKIKDDGIIGPATIDAINKINPDEFIIRFTVEKCLRYMSIVANDPSQTKFIGGWKNRLERIYRDVCV